MGHYTHFTFEATLGNNIPTDVREFITKCLTRDILAPDADIKPIFDHPFFHCPRWDSLLTWRYTSHLNVCGDIVGNKIFINTFFKNYDNEIMWFVDWISSYVDKENVYIMCKPEEYENSIEYNSLKNFDVCNLNF